MLNYIRRQKSRTHATNDSDLIDVNSTLYRLQTRLKREFMALSCRSSVCSCKRWQFGWIPEKKLEVRPQFKTCIEYSFFLNTLHCNDISGIWPCTPIHRTYRTKKTQNSNIWLFRFQIEHCYICFKNAFILCPDLIWWSK